MTASTPVAEPTTSPVEDISGPSWVLEYSSLDAPELQKDAADATKLIETIEELSESLKPFVPNARNLTQDEISSSNMLSTLVTMNKLLWQSTTLLRNVATYASCLSSVDATNGSAKKLAASMQVLFSRCKQAYEPASLILDLCPDSLFEDVINADEEVHASEFLLRHSRKMAVHKLSLDEENMITALSVTGHSSWGSLYDDLSSVIPVHVPQADGSTSTMGIATAEAMRDNKDHNVRKNSWSAIREAWLPHQETCAAALNAITGWRLDTYAKRKYDSPLVSSLHSNRMSQATLDALFHALDNSTGFARRALNIQAKALGKTALDPWDLFAPAPLTEPVKGKVYTFDEGIELIANAVGAIDEEGGKFVRMMRDKGWIEASRGDKKRPGAYVFLHYM